MVLEAVIFGKTSVDEALSTAAHRPPSSPASPDGGATTMTVAPPHRARPAPPRSRLAALLGRQPVGILFAAPYAVFLAAIFAYPLVLAVWISFHDYFFAAPGAEVDRPFVGLENYAPCCPIRRCGGRSSTWASS